MKPRTIPGLSLLILVGCPTVEPPPAPEDPPPELCDGADNDGDGAPGADESDSDGDGTIDCADCAPFDALAAPGAAESRPGIDDDCDGYVDEALDQLFADVEHLHLMPIGMGVPRGVQVVPPNILVGSSDGVWVARDQAMTDEQLTFVRVAPTFEPGPGPRMHWLFPGLGTTELGGITMGPDGAFWQVRGDGDEAAGLPLDLRPLLPPALESIGATLESIAVSAIRTISGIPGTALWHGGGGLARVRNLGEPEALEVEPIELPGGHGVATLTTYCGPDNRSAVILMSTDGTISINGYIGIVDVEAASVRWLYWYPPVYDLNWYHPFDWLSCLTQPEGPSLLAATSRSGGILIGSTAGAIEAADMNALLSAPTASVAQFGTDSFERMCSPGDVNGDGYGELAVGSGWGVTLLDGRGLGRWLAGEIDEAAVLVSSWNIGGAGLFCQPDLRSLSAALPTGGGVLRASRTRGARGHRVTSRFGVAGGSASRGPPAPSRPPYSPQATVGAEGARRRFRRRRGRRPTPGSPRGSPPAGPRRTRRSSSASQRRQSSSGSGRPRRSAS